MIPGSLEQKNKQKKKAWKDGYKLSFLSIGCGVRGGGGEKKRRKYLVNTQARLLLVRVDR